MNQLVPNKVLHSLSIELYIYNIYILYRLPVIHGRWIEIDSLENWKECCRFSLLWTFVRFRWVVQAMSTLRLIGLDYCRACNRFSEQINLREQPGVFQPRPNHCQYAWKTQSEITISTSRKQSNVAKITWAEIFETFVSFLETHKHFRNTVTCSMHSCLVHIQCVPARPKDKEFSKDMKWYIPT